MSDVPNSCVDAHWVALFLCGFLERVLNLAMAQAFTSIEACTKLLLVWLTGQVYLSQKPNTGCNSELTLKHAIYSDPCSLLV